MRCDNSEGAHNVQVEPIRPAGRRDEVFRLFASTRSALANSRKRRQLMTVELRRELRSHRETIKTLLMMIRRGWKAPTDDKALHSQAREPGARLGIGTVLNEWRQPPESLDADCDLPQEKRVLNAIQRHPEGVSIVEIGNELGVDFRRLLASTDTLLASGQIDQVQELLYPAER